MKKLIKLLNRLGFYTKKQYLQLKIKYSNDLEDLKVSHKRHITEVSKAYEEKLESLPFSFDELIVLWNDTQTNAFFYKLVSHIRDHISTRPLIQRWIDRLETAKKGIQIPN